MRPTLWFLAAVASLLAAEPASAQPSFNCATAKQPAEKAICKERKLADLDREVAKVFTATLGRLDDAGKKALREEQRAFVALRDWAFERPDFDLADYLTGRVQHLKLLDPRKRSGFAGVWLSLGGSVSVEAKDQDLDVAIETTDGAVGRWVCDFGGTGKPQPDGSLVVADEEENGGWSVRLRRSGPLLVVTAIAPAGADPTPPFCGANGTIDGTYLAATALPE
jgi:uncharacterized protein YecT (DUF1311 family)